MGYQPAGSAHGAGHPIPIGGWAICGAFTGRTNRIANLGSSRGRTVVRPFDLYEHGGTVPLGRPKTSTSRTGYAVDVVRRSGPQCVYCDRDLIESYEAWLDLSVDHVVPTSTSWYDNCADWLEDFFNIVTCCRACNEFLNRYKCKAPVPKNLSEFLAIRDSVYEDKRGRTRKRHREERRWYEDWKRRMPSQTDHEWTSHSVT